MTVKSEDNTLGASSSTEFFKENGYLIISDFYDVEAEIRPIQEKIQEIMEIVSAKYGLPAMFRDPAEAMSEGMRRLVAKNRASAGEVYDAVKQLPAFMRLLASKKNEQAYQALRQNSTVGIASGGAGIRIDHPNEEKFRAPWHQEFPAQLRSVDGIVFWSPLVEMEHQLGPVELAVGSHAEGIIPVLRDTSTGQSGAYSLRLDREQERLASYSKVSPLSKPGDLILIDFLTLHRSGENCSDRARWSMQFRYFNFADPTGQKIAWAGSFASGTSFETVLPELLAENK
ncbi:MAG: phytanoyl-CoA dioxygenase family protein [Rhodobiaceae bacterium]|nr:phytanoyl-CoA dioxygenase family protein [Rhodobiaceae bacterium]